MGQNGQFTAPLLKNKACLRCRARKVRCDTQRPVCSACKTSAVYQNMDIDSISCVYPDQEEADEGARRPKRKLTEGSDSSDYDGKISFLENKIAHLEKTLDNTNNRLDMTNTRLNSMAAYSRFETTTPGSTTGTSTGSLEDNNVATITAPSTNTTVDPVFNSNNNSSSNPIPTTSNNNDAFPAATTTKNGNVAYEGGEKLMIPETYSTLDQLLQPFVLSDFNFAGMVETDQGIRAATCSGVDYMNGDGAGAGAGGDSNSTDFGGTFASQSASNNDINLVATKWPNTLPDPHITKRLVDAYFELQLPTVGVVDKAKFQRLLALGPTNPKFPRDFLIHAICGLVSLVKPAHELGIDKEPYWKIFPSPSCYHIQYVKRAADFYHSQGITSLQHIQALILLCVHHIISAEFGQLWNYIGVMIRNVSNLSLHNLEKSYYVDDYGNASRTQFAMINVPIIFSPPADEEERRERAFIFWGALMCDRLSAAFTAKPMALPDEDFSTFLPTLEPDKGPLQDPSLNFNSMSPESSTFFTLHPPHLVGSVQLMHKAILLFNRTAVFIQRNSSKLAFKDNSTGQMRPSSDVKRLAGFRQLEDLISAFKRSIPEHLQEIGYNQNGQYDWYLSVSHMLPHVSTVLMHYPFIRNRPDDTSSQKCIDACRSAAQIAYSTPSSGNPTGDPLTPMLMGIVGRAMARELIRQRQIGSEATIQAATDELEDIITFVSRRDNSRGSLHVVEILTYYKTGAKPKNMKVVHHANPTKIL